MSRRRQIAIGCAGVLLAWILWDGLGHAGILDQDLFPPLASVFVRFLELGFNGDFVSHHLGGSLSRLLAASLIAVPLGIFIGIWLGTNKTAHAALNPIINFLLPLPKVAIFPLIMAIFGIGDAGKIILIGIGLFFPLFINVLIGTLRLHTSDYMDVAKIYGIKGVNLWWRIYGRGLATDVLTGLKASIGYGFTLIVVSEFSASRNGLGHFIWRAWDSFEILDMYAGVLWLCVLGWLAQAILDCFLKKAR